MQPSQDNLTQERSPSGRESSTQENFSSKGAVGDTSDSGGVRCHCYTIVSEKPQVEDVANPDHVVPAGNLQSDSNTRTKSSAFDLHVQLYPKVIKRYTVFGGAQRNVRERGEGTWAGCS